MNLDTEISLAKSLSTYDIKLIKYLPFLLQDIWELGTNPTDIIQLIKSLQKNNKELKVLDLACGKGATSIQLAKILHCSVKGIDIFDKFIDEAKQKSKEWKVENLCEFQCADINKAIKKEKKYDIVVLGAAGCILGDQKATVKKLKKTIKKDGFIIISDSYSGRSKIKGNVGYEEWRKIFTKAKLKLINEKIPDDNYLKEKNDEKYSLIEKRANELKEEYPDSAMLFQEYLESQREANDDLQFRLQSIVWILKK